MLKFHRIEDCPLSRQQAALIAAMPEEYDTNGTATHVAETELGELAVAFPLVEGSRLILVADDDATVKRTPNGLTWITPSPDEWYSEHTDAELEAGIRTTSAIF